MAPIITAFTPSVLDVATLEAMFVARQPLLDDLVETVRADVRTGSRTHRLLIGPRGIGKTHLITLLDHGLRNDEALSGGIVVAWLREELWEVDTYLAFLEAVLTSIAATSRSSGGYRDTLLSVPAPDAERQAEDLLWSLVGDRVLVVLVENLDLLAENLGRKGQARLRASMENRRQMSMIATTTSMPPDLYNSDAPFYGWFTPTHLDEFTLEEARELLIKVARLRDDEALAEFLAGDVATARLRVVTELAGGSPRVWVLLSQCIDVESIDELVPLFIKMLDDLTPYYQERLRALAPQQRRIVMELCRRGGGVPVNELADSIRADQRSISSQLRTLEKRGLVRKVELPSGVGRVDSRLSFYELREPLMRLALDVKESRGEPLGVVVQFLRHWYADGELAAIRRQVSGERLATSYVDAAIDLQNSVDLSGLPSFVVQVRGHPSGAIDEVIAHKLEELAEATRAALDRGVPPMDLVLTVNPLEPELEVLRSFLLAVMGSVLSRLSNDVPDLIPVLHLLAAALNYRAGSDASDLLRLPPEQRGIAVELAGVKPDAPSDPVTG